MAPFDYNWSQDTVYLAGNVASVTLWGFYVCLFAVLMFELKATRARYTVAVGGVILIFVMNLVETVINGFRVYRWFWNEKVHGVIDDSLFIAISDAMYIISASIPVLETHDVANPQPSLQSITADCILYWRLYIIWSRDRRVLIIPIAALLAAAVGNCFILKYDVMFITRPTDIHLIEVYTKWAEAMILAGLGINWLVTFLIVGKLYWVGHRVAAISGERSTNKYRSIILALIESGVLLSMTLGVLVGLNLTGCSNIAEILTFCLTRVAGIVPVLIILQLTMGFTQKSDTPAEPRMVVPKDVEAGIQETKPIPTGHPKLPRKDSLSFEFSATDSTPKPSDVEGFKVQNGLKAGLDARNVNVVHAVEVEQVDETPHAT